MEHPSIYHAIFQMNGKELRQYEEEWKSRYPGRYDQYEEHVEPYTYPAYMLFMAPVNNQVQSFFKIITDLNNLEKLPPTSPKETMECPECGLMVTALILTKCMKCWHLDLDESGKL